MLHVHPKNRPFTTYGWSSDDKDPHIIANLRMLCVSVFMSGVVLYIVLLSFCVDARTSQHLDDFALC